MSNATDVIAALEMVADWIDASGAPDDVAFIHSALVREAAHMIHRQRSTIYDLRNETNVLCDALTPFANEGRKWSKSSARHDLWVAVGVGCPLEKVAFTVGDCLRALRMVEPNK